jgi:hypothetical protein
VAAQARIGTIESATYGFSSGALNETFEPDSRRITGPQTKAAGYRREERRANGDARISHGPAFDSIRRDVHGFI